MAIQAKGIQAEIGQLPARKESTETGRTRYAARVIRTVDQFALMAPYWNAFLDVCDEVNISLRHEWLLLWLKTFPPAELLTVIVQDGNGQLVAVAPFAISRNDSGMLCRMLRRLQFIGTSPEVYDWMKIILHPEADADSVFRLVGEQLIRNRARWDVLDLRYIESQVQLMALHKLVQPFVRQLQVSQPMTIPYIDLPEAWSEYPATLRKRKYQSDLNRIHNHIRNDFNAPAADLVVHQPGEAADLALSRFLGFHQDYWLARGSRTEYNRHPQLLDFYRTVYRQFAAGAPAKASSKAPPTASPSSSPNSSNDGPVFEFSTLELGGEPISYHFDILSRQGCMGYLSCYEQNARKYRPGILHIEAMIARTHQLGGRRFEFGRGDEHYKNQWRIEKKPLWNLLAFRTPHAQAFWQLDDQLKQLKTLLKKETSSHGPNDHSAPTPDSPTE